MRNVPQIIRCSNSAFRKILLARDIDAGCLYKSAHSTGVSLDEAGVRWTFILCQLPIHPTAITAIHRSSRASPLVSFLDEILFS